MNAADMRGTLSVVGYHFDVVSLAKASMVCRIWKAAFGNHPKWKEFYLNSDEYLQDPLDKKGPWRILYGELFDKCKSLMHNKWANERYLLGLDSLAWNLECQGSIYVDDKLVIKAHDLIFMSRDQLKAKNMLTLVNENPTFQVKPSYCRISFPNDDECKKVESIRKTQLDKNHLYASANDGQLLRWERSRFPYGCMRVIKKGIEIHDFKIQNEILYILKSSNGDLNGESIVSSLYAYKNSEELWCLELSNGTDSDIMVNNNIGMILEWVNEEYTQNVTPPRELYLWDSRKCDKPIRVGTGWYPVLMNDEVIFAGMRAIKARSLKGSRVICEMNHRDIDGIIPDCELNLIHIITHREYITTFSLSEKKVISKIYTGILIPNPQHLKLLNGILYYVDDRGRLLLIDPKKGIIKKGPEKMFGSQIEVHNGRVHGLSPNRDRVVIVHSVESKTILEKIKSLAGKIKKTK